MLEESPGAGAFYLSSEIFKIYSYSNPSMKHDMHLDPLPFEEMALGYKTIESRVNDEKRQSVEVGDTITFYRRPENKDKISVRVIELHRYRSIAELVEATPLRYWGPRYHSKEELLQGKWYYSEEEIKKYGMLAIIVERINL